MSESRTAIRWDEFDRLCHERGWTTDPRIAKETGISYPMLRHLRTGYARPGRHTIDRVLRAFGDDAYSKIFSAEAA